MVPDAAVLVATVRALKAHSGKFKIVAGKPLPPELLAENPDDVRAGAANLIKQIENVKVHGVSPVVAINAFPGDFDSEHQAIREIAESVGARVAVCTHFSDGGKGATDLAQAVVEACDEPSTFALLLSRSRPRSRRRSSRSPRRSTAPATSTYTPAANTQLARYEKNGFGGLPVCIAKTHLSISADAIVEGRTDRPHAERARGPGIGRRRVHLPDLRRHDDDARPGLRARGIDHRLRRERRDRRAVMSAMTAVIMDGAQLRDDIVAELRAEIEAAGQPAGVPGDRAGRRRQAQPDLRAQQAEEGRRGRNAVAARRRSTATSARPSSKTPSLRSSPIPACTASSASCRCPATSMPSRCCD